jgi:hypothetical protein
MTLTSFTKLLGYICDSCLVDSDMASLCGGIVVPEIQLYCTLWYIAGGPYSGIKFFTGISAACFYIVVWRTICAIVQCKPLAIRFPKTAEEANAGVGIWYLATLGHRLHCFCGVCHDDKLGMIRCTICEDSSQELTGMVSCL